MNFVVLELFDGAAQILNSCFAMKSEHFSFLNFEIRSRIIREDCIRGIEAPGDNSSRQLRINQIMNLLYDSSVQ